MPRRLPFILRHVMYSLRGGFLVRPLVIALALGTAGAFVSGMEEAVPALSRLVPHWLFPSHSDPQIAQVILGCIATSVMTVVSIVFATLLMTLTLASMQFSPRIIVSFARDHITQWTLGIFLGTFGYCVAALPAAHTYPKPFEPVLSVMGAMLLATMCVAWLLFFIYHITQAISVGHIVDRIASETEAVIVETMPYPARHYRPTKQDFPAERETDATVLSPSSGYIRLIDTNRLLALATEHHFCVHVLRRVGHFVPEGVPLMSVTKDHKVTPEIAAALCSAIDLGPTRTLQQDVEFGILQIVDIALKAISPAVNDPTTAIGCIDQLSRVLVRFASRAMPEDLYAPPGVLRVRIHWLGLEGLLDSAFEQIRNYASGDIAVSIRLLRAMGDIGSTIPDQGVRLRLANRGRRIVEGVAARLGEDEVRPMRVRLAGLEDAVDQVGIS